MNNELQVYPYREHQDPRRAKVNAERARSQCQAALDFEGAMFDWTSRHLIIILTLGYQEQWSPFITFEDLRRDRDHFFSNMRSNRLLRGINGYIWKMEEGGPTAGHHMHLVIFYDRTSHGDIGIGDQVGQYWINVIAGLGRGAFNNSNRNKARYEQGHWGNATGTVDRHDWEKRTSLRVYLEKYMAKDEQHVTSRADRYDRTFGTSQAPD